MSEVMLSFRERIARKVLSAKTFTGMALREVTMGNRIAAHDSLQCAKAAIREAEDLIAESLSGVKDKP